MITDIGVIALVAAGVITGCSLAAGWAVRKMGTVIVNVASEKGHLTGKLLCIMALAEALALYGMLVAFMLLMCG